MSDHLPPPGDEENSSRPSYDDPSHNGNPDPQSTEGLPASVIFMQMMRQAAEQHHKQQAPEIDLEPAEQASPQEPLAAVPTEAPIVIDLPEEAVAMPVPPPSAAVETASAQSRASRSSTTEGAPSPAQIAAAQQSAAMQAERPAQPTGATAYVNSDDRYNAVRAAQKQQREQRRKQRRRAQTVSMIGGLVRTVVLIVVSGGLIATILSWWTSPEALDDQLRSELVAAQATEPAAALPTIIPTPNWMTKIGIISGHRGPENDPGAVCPDGLTEASINFAVAERVVRDLRGRGYDVDLLDEFDDRLTGYQGAVLVSIHANDCRNYGELVSGYLVAQAEARAEGGEDTRLRECVAQHYEIATGLERRFGLTRDMTDYHVFREISVTTPGVILELGFMLADRELLTTQPETLAQGVIQGILCFLNPMPAMPTPPPAMDTPAPTEAGVGT